METLNNATENVSDQYDQIMDQVNGTEQQDPSKQMEPDEG